MVHEGWDGCLGGLVWGECVSVCHEPSLGVQGVAVSPSCRLPESLHIPVQKGIEDGLVL